MSARWQSRAWPPAPAVTRRVVTQILQLGTAELATEITKLPDHIGGSARVTLDED
jgi:hypothetical protein